MARIRKRKRIEFNKLWSQAYSKLTTVFSSISVISIAGVTAGSPFVDSVLIYSSSSEPYTESIFLECSKNISLIDSTNSNSSGGTREVGACLSYFLADLLFFFFLAGCFS